MSSQDPMDSRRPAGASRTLRTIFRAREDAILFPALHELMTEKEFDEMGDKFEDRERELFGAKGFEGVVDQIAAIEKSLGIYDLNSFTPAVKIEGPAPAKQRPT